MTDEQVNAVRKLVGRTNSNIDEVVKTLNENKRHRDTEWLQIIDLIELSSALLNALEAARREIARLQGVIKNYTTDAEELAYKEGYRVGMLTACEVICFDCRKGDVPKHAPQISMGLYLHFDALECDASKILYLMEEAADQHQHLGDQGKGE